MSPPLAIIGALFLAYAQFGHFLPGIVSHRPFGFDRIAEAIVLGVDGMFGSTFYAMVTMIWFFLIFGVFLSISGAGQGFIDFAFALTARRQGGPALAAVISSWMFGMVSGSGVANVLTIGTFTIPLMKRVGYKPHFAGAVEAAASMGGQITPPVLGSAAFLICALTGITYLEICKAALIPMFCYYACILLFVYFEAGRLGLKALPRDQAPRFNKALFQKASVPFSSIFVILIILILGYTPRVAAAVAVVWLVFVGIFYKGTRLNPANILRGLSNGFVEGAGLAAVLATAGLTVGIINISGIGMKFAALMVSIGEASLLYAIFSIMLASLFLGTGLPTPAAYVILAILAAPAMVKLGAPLLLTHMIIFYYAVFAGLSPPEGAAFMAAAGIAGAPPMKTGLVACKVAIVGIIMPILWLYKPYILIQGPWYLIIWTVFATFVGVYFVTISLVGYGLKAVGVGERLAYLVLSFALLFLNFNYQIIILVILGVMHFVHYSKYKKTLLPTSSI
jgi:TRAP transporter 4TM/12TM fusion protein